ncbi:MAG: hypothetical protein GXP31_01340 [Kiritimatiellaeota bacterium]|nr:hypothetical protein [Kiritimatiellota bacterium]
MKHSIWRPFFWLKVPLLGGTVLGVLAYAPYTLAAGPGSLAPSVSKSLERSTAFLLSRRRGNGAWLDHPAVTSLACAALLGVPGHGRTEIREAVDRGLDYVVGLAQPDGSIWNRTAEDYPNYSTSISLIALALANRSKDARVVRAARDFLLKSQFKGDPDRDPSYGGIGYGKKLRPDLSNTQWALEALYLTDYLDREPFTRDRDRAQRADLAWKRALTFLSRCQNLPETNDQVWVASDPDNRGGFVYMPGESKAGEIEQGGRKSLRSYGSMTYAGLKSMIYARLSPDDPRVKAAVDWVRRHYTFAENPGMGSAGLYYYLHTCAKALAAYGQDALVDAAGKRRLWRRELTTALIKRQRPDGSWVNANGRWWESIPELTTAYAMLTIEVAQGRMPAAVGTRRVPARGEQKEERHE